MATIYLVRHGKASAGFDSHLDPGLDETGRAQAQATADVLEPLGPLSIYSSPLARALETARTLAERWGVTPLVEPRVAEIPSPSNDPADRGRWLRGVMTQRWSVLSPELQEWRRAMIDCACSYPTDCVVFCHFVAINVIVGAATGVDKVISFRPGNGSVTKICVAERELSLIELGLEASTRVD